MLEKTIILKVCEVAGIIIIYLEVPKGCHSRFNRDLLEGAGNIMLYMFFWRVVPCWLKAVEQLNLSETLSNIAS